MVNDLSAIVRFAKREQPPLCPHYPLSPSSQHFKSHRDTPRDELAFGTLVVALPSKFHGGCLKVRHRGRENTCDWGRRLTKEEDDIFLSKYTILTTPAKPVLQW